MRPTTLEVNLSQLKQNLENIRAHVAPAKVLVVLKANAYGHGVDGVAPFIARFADYIGVAIVEEGIHLRKMGIATPILVMGGTLPEQLPDFFEFDLTLAASSLDLLTAADQLAASTRKRLKTHLKIDTGMERIGVREYEAEAPKHSPSRPSGPRTSSRRVEPKQRRHTSRPPSPLAPRSDTSASTGPDPSPTAEAATEDRTRSASTARRPTNPPRSPSCTRSAAQQMCLARSPARDLPGNG